MDIKRKGEKTGDCSVFYERNKKAFNFDEDDAIRLYASKKYDGTSLSSLSDRKTFLVFFILFREWPFLDKVKLHTGHNKEWKSKRKRRTFWGEKEKRVLPIAKYFVFIRFWLHEADDTQKKKWLSLYENDEDYNFIRLYFAILQSLSSKLNEYITKYIKFDYMVYSDKLLANSLFR